MADEADDRVRVLVLGGWSPGPLDALRRTFRSECVFFEPTLQMPPAGFAWLCMWETALLAVCFFALWTLVPSQQSWLARLVGARAAVAAAAAILLCLPMLIVLVRSATKARAA